MALQRRIDGAVRKPEGVFWIRCHQYLADLTNSTEIVIVAQVYDIPVQKIDGSDPSLGEHEGNPMLGW